MSDLGRRAALCAAWRWMPGMLDEHGDRVVAVDSLVAANITYANVGDVDYCTASEMMPPVLEDPATLGGLLALVREAWGPDHYVTLTPATPMGGQWEVSVENSTEDTVAVCLGDTQGEALVVALERHSAIPIAPSR